MSESLSRQSEDLYGSMAPLGSAFDDVRLARSNAHVTVVTDVIDVYDFTCYFGGFLLNVLFDKNPFH